HEPDRLSAHVALVEAVERRLDETRVRVVVERCAEDERVGPRRRVADRAPPPRTKLAPVPGERELGDVPERRLRTCSAQPSSRLVEQGARVRGVCGASAHEQHAHWTADAVVSSERRHEPSPATASTSGSSTPSTRTLNVARWSGPDRSTTQPSPSTR